MKFATKSQYTQVLAWLIWVIVLLVFIRTPESNLEAPNSEPPVLMVIITHHRRDGSLFPWEYRLRVIIRRRRWALRRTCRHVVWAARLAKLALRGALTMAQIVDWLTRAQLRRHLGVLPVLYGLRETVNRHGPTAAEVDHGTVVMVLILNRLVAPRPLYQIADWLARTVLVYTLRIPATKFNDGRLGRTLDPIIEHSRDIWQEVVHQALVQADIDLSIIFYDLTAFTVHGEYANSEHVDSGFAHNTPMDKPLGLRPKDGGRKFKTGLNVVADGNIPTEYKMWTGRTTDVATVQENMERLRRLLEQHGWPVGDVIIIGDRANLNNELAIAYQDKVLRYLAGLQARKKALQQLLAAHPEKQFHACPLDEARGRNGYWGRPCQVSFEHEGRQDAGFSHLDAQVQSDARYASLQVGSETCLYLSYWCNLHSPNPSPPMSRRSFILAPMARMYIYSP